MSGEGSLLPFLLTDGARPTLATEDAAARDRRVDGTRMGACYHVPLAGLSGEELSIVKRELHMTPLDGGFCGVPSPPFDVFVDDGVSLQVPRFYGYARWGPPTALDTVLGEPLEREFRGTLNPTQQEAVDATLARLLCAPHGALLVLPCGYGKTVCALHIAHRLGRRTLVLVHKGFLVEQWQERVEQFLPGATCGRIQQLSLIHI